MAKPFVSHDGTDANGVRAEVWVQTGTGTVKELSENGRNVLVKMSVEGLKHPVQGWTSKQEPIFAILTDAASSGREVSYRIEAQRKPHVDRATPIADLRVNTEVANDNTRLIFVGVDGTLSSEAVTDPQEDPSAGGRIPATDPRNKPAAAGSGPSTVVGGFSAEQALTGLANARKGGLPPSIADAAAALALAAGATVEQVLTAGVDAQQERAPRAAQRSMAKEAAPYVAYNTDGRVNIGSYMVQAASGAESLAADLMQAHAIEVADRHNAAVAAGEIEGPEIAPQPLNFKNAAALAAILLDLADRVQVSAYGGGRPDRMATSHSRARGLVYDSVKNRNPIPFGQGEQAQEQWKSAVVAEATERLAFIVKIATEVTFVPSGATGGEQGNRQAPERVPAGAAQGSEVRQISTATSEKPPVLVEGEEGFVAPSAEVLSRFADLAQNAGFLPGTPDSPVGAYLDSKFGVSAARKVHGQVLDTLVAWYENQGPEGAVKFREHVRAVAPTSEPVEPVEPVKPVEVDTEAAAESA